MILQRTIDTFCGRYDFNTTGGAIGSYDLQIPIPKNAVVLEFGVIVERVLTGALLAASVSFDTIYTDVSPKQTILGVLMGPTSANLFTQPQGVLMGACSAPNAALQTGNGGDATQNRNSISVGMSISGGVLTGGALMIFTRCVIFDLPN